MLDMAFTPYEKRLLPWIFTAVILAMVLGFALLDFVEQNPSTVRAFFAAEGTYDAPRSLPELIRRGP